MENNNWSIQSVINDFLQKEMEERKNKKNSTFHASSLGTCKRKQIWKRMNEPETNPAEERALRIFSVGDIFHIWLQGLLEKAGVLIDKEVRVENKEYNYSGRYDALVEKDGKKLLYDFKSQSSKSFGYLEKGIDDNKKMQIVSYVVMGNLPIEECRILFISKDDLRILEVPIKVEDYRQKVINELTELNDLFKKGEMPEGKECWECKYCSYRDKCQQKQEKLNLRKNGVKRA